MCRRRRSPATSLAELLIAVGLFSLLIFLLWVAMKSTSKIWQRTSGRDAAIRELLKARSHLTRDLANASKKTTQFATSRTGPSLASGWDGDALTFLTCDDGARPWNVTSTGASIMTAEITYALFIPQNVNTLYGYSFTGLADSNGYEQSCPFKWLMRRQDPAPAAVPPADPVIPSNWTSAFLARPASFVPGPNQQAVATQLLGFRVLNSGSVWQLELKALAIEDARREIGIGSAALGSTVYTIAQKFNVPAHN